MSMNLARQMFSFSAANIINAAVPFLLLPILTAYLLPEEYGLLSLILMLQILVLPIVLINFAGMVLIAYSKMSKDEFTEFINSILIIPVFGFVVVAILFTVFSRHVALLFKIPEFWVVITPLFVIVQALPLLVPIVFQAEKRPLAYGAFKIPLTFANMIFSILFVVHFKYGIEGRLWGIFLSNLLFNGVAVLILLKKGLIGFSIKAAYVKEALRFGIPLIPHTIAGTLLAMSDRIFLVNMLSVNDVGIYSVSFQVASAIAIITISINQAWAPNLFESLNSDPSREQRKTLVKQTYFIMFVMASGTLIFILIVPFIFDLFIDQKYHDGKVLAELIAVGFMFRGFYLMVTHYLLFTKKTYILSIATLSSAVLVMCINYLFIPVFGLYGSAYAMIISYFLFFIAVWVLANRYYRMPWKLNAGQE